MTHIDRSNGLRRVRPALRKAGLALALTSACGATGAAQAQDGVTWLGTIAVIGTRTETSVQDNPASVTVLDRQEMERKTPESVAEMLRDVPGVEVVDSSAPGMKRISIRGESSRRVTILVDGQEITDHSDYGTPVLIDPSNVERIEVVRGPASVLHGAKAIGGVVNIITKRGADKPVEVETGGTYYSGTAGWQGWAAVSGTVGNFDYRFSGSLDDHGDRRVPDGRYTSTGRLDGTAFGNDNISAHLGYTFGEAGNHYIAVKAMQHRLWSESWTDPATLVPPIVDFRIDLPKRDLRKVGLHYEGSDISDIVRKVRLDGYYQEVDRLFTNEVAIRPNPMLPVVQRTRTVSEDVNTHWGGTAQVDLQFHPDHYTIVGLHYLDDSLAASKATAPVPAPPIVPAPVTDDASIRTVSAFAQNEWSFADDFRLTAGARYYHTRTDLAHTSDPDRQDYAGRSDGRFVTSLGLVYTGIGNTTLRALYSEGYITPTLFQLFSDSIARERVIFGNPALKPETSRNAEIGARYDAGGLIVDATAFYSEAQDYITRATCASVGTCPGRYLTRPRFIYDNANTARTYGLELAAEYILPGTTLTPYVTGTWMRRELTFDTVSTYHSNTPALSGRFGLRWEGELAGRNVWSDLYVRAATAVSEQEEGGPLRRLPGWATLNLAFGGAFGEDEKYRFSVAFNNILDKEYRSSFDEVPGIGRSVEATVRVKF
ncbi:TonB-dependent receptor plug domain-containing protein [Aquamicrobium sp.]|uniref:TonB-dependent receptor plug domain-containing protein n=1 Tax=Aquamicrobium sp. TaxID=1872579 RepID=UPI00349E954F